MKQTKIIATMGPASANPEIIEKLILAGVDVFRLNFSHGTHEAHTINTTNIRQIADRLNKAVGIMGDLQGPKIRVSKFENNSVNLINGNTITLDTTYQNLGNAEIVGVDYKNLANDLKGGDILLLDDGKIILKVTKVSLSGAIACEIVQGGNLKNNKGINKLGGGLTAPALTEKDLEDIKFAAKQNLDFVAVSFPKDANDINLTRNKLAEVNSNAKIIAKIERTEAVFKNMDAIVKASDGIMVARGDLAVEVGEALVPGLQKKIIKRCHKFHKISIVATQMLESMISSPVATRAEVSDIANAVLDGTDAVMLSAETASGEFPLQAVETMTKVCTEAEKTADSSFEANFFGEKFSHIQQTIAMSALFSAYHLSAKAILTLTSSGATAKWLSRVNSGIPIYAVTNSKTALQGMTMYRGVHPMYFEHSIINPTEHIKEVCDFLKSAQIMHLGDTLIITLGDHIGKVGSTNTLKVITL